MSSLHLGNIYADLDLTPSSNSIANFLSLHPNYLQLQFLPLLYREKESDPLLLFHRAPKGFEDRCQLDHPNFNLSQISIEPWGISDSFLKLLPLEKKTLFPSLSLVKTLASKAWSFPFTAMPNSLLIDSSDALTTFFSKNPIPVPFVIKKAYGFSSRGNILFLKDQDLRNPLKIAPLYQEIEKDPLIVQPWLTRSFDFSTQWKIETRSMTCLGATELLNSSRGSYLGNVYDQNDPFLKTKFPLIENHYLYVQPILEMIQQLGYRGNIGLDAFFYLEKNRTVLHPLIEINLRKTMGFVTIALAKNRYPNQHKIGIRLVEAKTCKNPLLPKELSAFGQHFVFKKNLEIFFDI